MILKANVTELLFDFSLTSGGLDIMKLHNFYLFFILFILLFSSSFSTEMVEASFNISDINRTPVEGASIKIGDLIIKTDRFGIAKCLLFPASYEVIVERNTFYPVSSQFEITASNNQFTFLLESKLTPVNFKITDSFSNLPVSLNVKFQNQSSKQITFSASDKNGLFTIPLEKKSIYTIEISENKYKPYKMTLDTNNLMESSINIPLIRDSFGVKIKSNANSGTYSIKSLENSSVFTGSFSGQVLALLLPFGKYEFILNSDNYKQFSKNLVIDSSYEESISMIPSFKNFNFFLKIGDKNDFLITNEKLESYTPVKNFKVSLLKNSKTVLPLKLSENSVSVPFGTYDISATSDFSEPLYFPNITFDENSPESIVFTAKESYSFISGTVSTSGSLLGGVTVVFTDAEDNSYQADTTIEGSYSLKLPPRNYKVTIEKNGYRPVVNSTLTTDKMVSNKNYTMNFSLEEVPSIITGKVTTLSGAPVANAKITVKLEKNESIFYTEDDGSYKIQSTSGLLMIKVEKQGIKSKGVVKMLNRFSTLTGVDFKVEEIVSSIEGSITDGSTPLGNIQIQLFSDNKLITSVISRQDGAFYFENLSSFKKYTIIIENVNYLKYTGTTIDLSALPIKNFNIILSKNIIPILLDFRDSSNTPVANTEVLINNQTYKTDINGFLESSLKISDEKKILNLSIPSLNYFEVLEVPKDTKSLFKKSIIIKQEKRTD